MLCNVCNTENEDGASFCIGCGRMLEDADLREVRNALSGKYEVIREIGRGGMAIVYQVRDVMLDRPRAIKVLPKALSFNERVRKRFLQEIQVLARLNHRNIIQIFSADVINGITFFTMPLVEGETLSAMIARKKTLPEGDVVEYVSKVCEALKFAHSTEVFHRDLKPDNIMIGRIENGGENLYVMDFGIAKVMGETGLTTRGHTVGTLRYMSPEQCSGKEGVDGRSDLYALGVMMYEMLSGRVPLDGSSTDDLLSKQVKVKPESLANVAPYVSAGLVKLVDGMLEKRKENRPQSAEAVLEAIAKLSGKQVKPDPVKDEGRKDDAAVETVTVVKPVMREETVPDIPVGVVASVKKNYFGMAIERIKNMRDIVLQFIRARKKESIVGGAALGALVLIVVLWLALSCPRTLYPFKAGNNWGAMDSDGEEVIRPTFDGLGEFFEGRAWYLKNGKIGFIGTSGKAVTDPIFDFTGNFHEGKAWVHINGVYDYIDLNGKRMNVNQNYSCVYDFSDGLARVSKRDGNKLLFGFINRSGEEVIPPRFTSAGDFYEGFACARDNMHMGYIDKSGDMKKTLQTINIMLESEIISAGLTNNNTAFNPDRLSNANPGDIIQGILGFGDQEDWFLVGGNLVNPVDIELNHDSLTNIDFEVYDGTMNNLIGSAYSSDVSDYLTMSISGVFYIRVFLHGGSDRGEYSLSLNRITCSDFHEGRASIRKNGKFTYIDSNFNTSIFEYDRAGNFSEGLARASMQSRWGYVTASGDVKINFQYDRAFDFSEGLAAVVAGGIIKYIDRDNRPVFELAYRYPGIDTSNEKAIMQDRDAYVFKNGVAKVYVLNPNSTYDFKIAYINREGKFLRYPF